jgi:hypothetical protein
MSPRFHHRFRLADGLRPDLGAAGLLIRDGLPELMLMDDDGSPSFQDLLVGVDTEGRVVLTDAAGEALGEEMDQALRRHHGDGIRAWLEAECQRWNRAANELRSVHHGTPAPLPVADFLPRPLSDDRPSPPDYLRPSFLDRLVAGRHEAVSRENLGRQMAYEEALDAWEKRHHEHLLREEARRVRFEEARAGDAAAIEDFLALHLGALEWPLETLASVEAAEGEVHLDVGVPRLETFPAAPARLAEGRLGIERTPLPATRREREYMHYVHGAIFRLAGETFHQLPRVERVVVSAHVQDPTAVGHELAADFLLSVSIPRGEWCQVNFTNLAAIHLPACLDRFEVRREMSGAGALQPVEPFAPERPAPEPLPQEPAERVHQRPNPTLSTR